MKTTSLILSKQLKEAGFPQRTAFTYREDDLLIYHNVVKLKKFKYYAAPLAEEILDLLPEKISVKGLNQYLFITPFRGSWDIRYRTLASFGDQEITDFEMKRYGNGMRGLTNGQPAVEMADSLADAAAKMYLYLAKNNLLPEPPSSDKGGEI